MLEALSKSLQPYKETIGNVASVVTIAQFFSGAILCRDIYRKGTTKGISSIPFIGGVVMDPFLDPFFFWYFKDLLSAFLFSLPMILLLLPLVWISSRGILMIKYSLLLEDSAMLQVNVAAVFLNAIYMVIYYVYSQDRYLEIYKPLSYGVGLIGIFLGYASVESEDNLEFRYGLLVTVLMLLLLGSPLADLKQIIEKEDASSIPLPLTFMGAIVTFLWFIYGIILLNSFMLVQNAIGFCLCIIQLILLVKYPGKPTEMTE